ncbi:MAG TPA: molybdopterin-dependent oxidoreductase [Galbitalea sp.]|jgi:DMSO/TMAO reductase YedYZ molybdopterin-dependent catalytic subunit
MQRLMYAFRQALLAPSRNTRTAVVIGRLLGSAFIICFVTGIYSHFIQDPIPGMVFLTRPIWLYQVSQGIHITAGILCFPLIFAKLYSVFPRLFQTPPITSFGNFLERASITLFVSSSLVEIVIGLLNTFQWYALFAFPFRQTHFTLSFIIIGSLAIHIACKLPLITRYWTKKASYDEDGEVKPTGEPVPAVARLPLPDVGIGYTSRIFAWIDKVPEPKQPKVSRRAFMTTIAATGATVVALTAGQSFRFLDFANIFAPRKNNTGPTGLPVNRTAHAAKVLDSAMSPDWKLTVVSGSTTKSFSRKELEALPQYLVALPIACVEGWSQMANWKGPRLKDVMREVGAPQGAGVRAISLEQGSSYAKTEMEPEFVRDDLTLVALELNGEVLDIDHGYPARMIAPARPGVLQTKWLSRLESI